MPFTSAWRAACGALSLLVLITLLGSCAPRVTASSENFNAAFSDRGVLWVLNGRVFLARAPAFEVEAVRTPVGVADVAWHDGDAWVALPAAGWVQRVTGAGGVIQAGAVSRLSSQRIYREDGSALTYKGQGAAGLLGPPDVVMTGGDGVDYALQRGRLYRIGQERVLVNERAPGSFLARTPQGVAVTTAPAVVSVDFTYRIENGFLQRVDAASVVRSQVPHGPGLVGLVGEVVVTVSRDGALRVFRYDLTEVKLQ